MPPSPRRVWMLDRILASSGPEIDGVRTGMRILILQFVECCTEQYALNLKLLLSSIDLLKKSCLVG